MDFHQSNVGPGMKTGFGTDRASGPAKCRSCGGELLYTFANLGMSPPSERWLLPNQLEAMEPHYPLHAMVCAACLLVQLKDQAVAGCDLEECAERGAAAHPKENYETLVERLSLGTDSLVVEFGSNDGWRLQHFARNGVPVLGIEPVARLARSAVAKGIPTIDEVPGPKVASALLQRGVGADLIILNSTPAQTAELNELVCAARALLKPEGMMTLDFQDMERLISERRFDVIRHEQLSYFSLFSIVELVKRHGLKVIDVEMLKSQSGMLRVYFAHHASWHGVRRSVGKMLEREGRNGLTEIETYVTFNDVARRAKRGLLGFLVAEKSRGKTICGVGASGTANALLNFCGIGPDLLDFIADRDSTQHGRLTPGTHLPILPVEVIEMVRPDYVLILPFDADDEIASSMAQIGGWGGKFVVPLPSVRILDPAEMGQELRYEMWPVHHSYPRIFRDFPRAGRPSPFQGIHQLRP